jgi:hypothetical protein
VQGRSLGSALGRVQRVATLQRAEAPVWRLIGGYRACSPEALASGRYRAFWGVFSGVFLACALGVRGRQHSVGATPHDCAVVRAFEIFAIQMNLSEIENLRICPF